MKEHAVYGALIRDAVVRGDLETTRHAARDLVVLSTEPWSGPGTKIGEMILAAQRVAVSQNTNEAARAFSALSEKCGACHAAFGGPRSFPAEPPPDALDRTSRMRRHQWGVARLWEGLVAPSNEAWSSGAQTLADAPLQPELLAPGKTISPEVEALARSVHDLGRRAAAATTADSNGRVELYGELMTTCADCHQRVGGGPVGIRK